MLNILGRRRWQKLLALALAAMLSLGFAAYALADGFNAESITISVDGTEIDASPAENSDKAICLPLLSMVKALGCDVDLSEISEGDTVRKVYTITPEEGSVLMVAFSITDEEKLSAVAISKDQILMPLKQSMILVNSKPYLPVEFFETGLCASFKLDKDSGTLTVTSGTLN